MSFKVLLTDLNWIRLRMQLIKDYPREFAARWHNPGVYLHFYDQKKLTFFLLKYGEYLTEIVETKTLHIE